MAGPVTPYEAETPETLRDAIELAVSSGAQALLNAAAVLASRKKHAIHPEDLFVAALAIGATVPEPTPTMNPSSSSYARASQQNPTAADSWLFDWFVAQVGITATTRFVQGQVKSAFSLPAKLEETVYSQGNTRLSPEAGALLSRASYLAEQTSPNNKYGVRHIVSSLILPDPSGANAGLHLLVEQGFKIKLASAANTVLRNAIRDLPASEAVAWKEFFKEPTATPIMRGDVGESVTKIASDASPTTVEANSTPPTADETPFAGLPIITLSGFASDSHATGITDPLGINPDVRAFARLICLEEATPPLSICLFGEWGSGKSTFMERLQREITRLTRQKRPVTSASPAAGEPKFVENIVQIRFNAWHFADASLWASLTAVFFDQLRRGGYDGGRASDYQELIGKVASRVRSLEAYAAEALQKVGAAKRNSDAARKALDSAEKQLAANDLTLAWSELQEFREAAQRQ